MSGGAPLEAICPHLGAGVSIYLSIYLSIDLSIFLRLFCTFKHILIFAFGSMHLLDHSSNRHLALAGICGKERDVRIRLKQWDGYL
jgi:hypothetical protein